MKVESAFALTPAAIMSEANVWRHPCSVIQARPAASESLSARRATVAGSKGCPLPLANTYPRGRRR